MSYFPFTLNQLYLLHILVNQKSISLTAKKLSISVNKITFQLRKLETSLGVKLIQKEQKKLTLTNSGKILLKYGKRILYLCEEAKRLIKLKKLKQRKQKITIGSTEKLATYFLFNIISFLNRKTNNEYFEFVVYPTDQLIWSLKCNKIDIGFINNKIYYAFNLYKNKNSLKKLSYIKSEMKVVLANNSFYSGLKTISIDDLYKFKLILPSNNLHFRKSLNNLFYSIGIDRNHLRIKRELDSIESIKDMVISGAGVSFLPTIYVRKEIRSGDILALNFSDRNVINIISLVFKPQRSAIFLNELNYKVFEFFLVLIN